MKTKKKNTFKNSLYYTEKNPHFVRVFFKILYTLFTFDFIIEKIPLYNTEKNSNTKGKIIIGDSRTVNIGEKLQQLGIDKVQFIICHPPYWDIIKFSDNENDLSNCEILNDFLGSFGQVIDNTSQYLEKNRYCAVVIGDKYANSEIVPFGFYCMNLFMMRGFKMKAIFVKNFDETKGKANQNAIWRYRALASDFYLFKHEYIFIFKKTK